MRVWLEVGRMLLLDEESYRSLSESKRMLYLLQWLQNLPHTIRTTEKVV